MVSATFLGYPVPGFPLAHSTSSGAQVQVVKGSDQAGDDAMLRHHVYLVPVPGGLMSTHHSELSLRECVYVVLIDV
jgi:hypothetical protein